MKIRAQLILFLSLVIIIAYQNCSDVAFKKGKPVEILDKSAPIVKGVSAPGQAYVPDYMTLHGSNKVMFVTLVQTLGFETLILEITSKDSSAVLEECIVEYTKTDEQLIEDEVKVPVNCWMPVGEVNIQAKGLSEKKGFLANPELATMTLDNIDVFQFDLYSRGITPKEWTYPTRTIRLYLTDNANQRKAFDTLQVRIVNSATDIVNCSVEQSGIPIADGWRFYPHLRFGDYDNHNVDCKLQTGGEYRVEIIGLWNNLEVHKDVRPFNVVEPAFNIEYFKVVGTETSSPEIHTGDTYSLIFPTNKRLELYVNSNNPEAIARFWDPSYGIGLQFTYPQVDCVYSGNFIASGVVPSQNSLFVTALGANHYKISIPYSAISGNCHEGMDGVSKGLVSLDLSTVYGSGFGHNSSNIPAKQFWFYHGYNWDAPNSTLTTDY